MTSWAERVHRRAADFSSVVTSCGHPGSSAPTYPYRLEKVKFGIPLDEVCKNDNIPGPLLVLILKLNKESPNKRDVFRAPGHQGAMKKLIHFLQAGRLVNVDNYSVYTIASVLKKFLRKIPNGIFGRSGEKELFTIIELSNEAEQNERLHKLFTSLPKYTQHLLVLLFGTFRVIASNAAHAGTGMTSEALGVSVAPSFFQSCVSDGKTARMEDVLKFKVATKIMKHIIDKFATHDLFGRDNYEYYARVTGRILKVQDEWICSFQYPPPPRGKIAQQKYALQHSLEAEKTWLQCQCERWGLLAQEESRSTPALLTSSSSALDNSVVSLGVTPEHSFMESCARLSVSLEGPGLFAMTSSPLPARSKHEFQPEDDDDDLDENEYNDEDDDHDNNANERDDGNDEEDEHIQYAPNDHLPSNVDFANVLDISSHINAANIENQSKNANFHLTTRATSSAADGNSRKMLKSRSSSKEHTTVALGDCTLTDSQDDVDGDDMMRGVVKRRYKQNKKKSPGTLSTSQMRGVQQQRRLRSNPTNSKSLDVSMKHHSDFLTDYEYVGKSSTSSTTLKALSTDPAPAYNIQQKSRVCSRCKRGIRHSSSCSSSTASGSGANGTNGSAMTMEELRAVNRYAESTKSLSYLPQVHERQTARMRTRSEWFLGPKDGDILCVIPNTCSNCYLTVQKSDATSRSYLGGGSTRDMRRVEQPTDFTVAPDHAEAVNASLCLFYTQQQQQQLQQLQPSLPQRQSFHMSPDFMMETDEGYAPQASAHSSTQHHQQQPHLLAPSQHRQLTPRPLPGTGGVYLDANYVGNIRLSNSAESVQFPARRPSTRRILLGANIPRQYPLRSSLRRHKEKLVGANTLPSSATTSSTPSTTRPVSTAGAFLSNSSAESPALTSPLSSSEYRAMDCTSTITFKAPRL